MLLLDILAETAVSMCERDDPSSSVIPPSVVAIPKINTNSQRQRQRQRHNKILFSQPPPQQRHSKLRTMSRVKLRKTKDELVKKQVKMLERRNEHEMRKLVREGLEERSVIQNLVTMMDIVKMYQYCKRQSQLQQQSQQQQQQEKEMEKPTVILLKEDEESNRFEVNDIDRNRNKDFEDGNDIDDIESDSDMEVNDSVAYNFENDEDDDDAADDRSESQFRNTILAALERENGGERQVRYENILADDASIMSGHKHSHSQHLYQNVDNDQVEGGGFIDDWGEVYGESIQEKKRICDTTGRSTLSFGSMLSIEDISHSLYYPTSDTFDKSIHQAMQ
eukprot:m.27400 g.27400  ORF g.27400 m.27400 type:complete len:335 (+) comp5937_c0_seq1:253-1257(+)